MYDVQIAELRSRLGQLLRNVQSGKPITVWRGTTPIARILPYEEEGTSLTVRHPRSGAPSLKQISLPPPLKLR
ncbi:MAG: type II toxin-antitoxin system prevent-host-death family antitoxin [Nitrospira sp.]|nr:type II toxin-antitoxin system prevent-host-death family antitoxin [Nitrospira sp.]